MNGGSAGGRLRRAVKRVGAFVSKYSLLDRALALALLLAMLGIRLWDPLPVGTLRLRAFDAYQSLLPRQSTARPVVIADIDERSIAALGQWPWPRTQMADLVTKLKALGALAIGFDVVFPEPDRMSPASISKGLPQLDAPTRATLESLPSNDELFAAAMKDGRVVLGESALNVASDGRGGKPKVGFATVGPSALRFVRQYPSLLPNVPVLEQAAAGRGLFTIAQDADGIVRRVPMVIAVGNQLFPSLTLEMLRVLTGAGGILVKTDQTGVLGVGLPGLQLPTDSRGRVWVHFTEHDPNRFVSAKDILSGEVPKARIAGKIVLVGTSALGLLDNKTTPVSDSMAGVEVHAQVLEGALTNGMLNQPSWALAYEIIIALATGLAIIVFAPMLGPLILLLLGAVIAVGLVGFSWWKYKNDSLLIDATYPLLSSWIVYSALAFMNYLREQSGRRRIRQAFSQYMSPDLVSQLAQSSEKLVLGGETRVMSIMFSDVRGFTTISESYKKDPQGLTTLMNRFLTPLTNAIIDHKGTIDKYMGDAIMAFWNAPLKDSNQEQNACLAALDMQRRLAALNAERKAEAEAEGKTLVPLDVGIGINTGECVVGNMGSDLRFDYSVLGDTVNLASRLEGQSKTYGIRTVLGNTTANAVKEAFALVELDLLQVKGKKEPEAVWTLLGDREVLRQPEFQTLARTHADMLSRYRGRDFEGAESLLETCRSLGSRFGLTALYELYRERIAHFKESPPPEDWTGVYTATSK